MVANGVLISGMAGGDRTTRGFLDGWDPETGKKLWRRYTIPAPGEPGSETWPKNSPTPGSTAAARPGRTGSYDPELDLVYWGTGNAEPYNPDIARGAGQPVHRERARDPAEDGRDGVALSSTCRMTSYDFDGTAEPVLADLPIDGQMRKVLISANKNGFLYVIDRTNGKLIAAHPYVKVNWAKRYRSQDRPAGADRRATTARSKEKRWKSGRRAAPTRR